MTAHDAALSDPETRVERVGACTGVSAAWCPVCGDCTCPRDAEGHVEDEAPDCPLHAASSKHGEDQAGKVRVTLDLDPRPYATLGWLASHTGQTKAAVLRDALSLLDYYAKRVEAGGRFQFVRDGHPPETVLLLAHLSGPRP